MVKIPEKASAEVGVDSATGDVCLVLSNDTVTPGQAVNGTVFVTMPEGSTLSNDLSLDIEVMGAQQCSFLSGDTRRNETKVFFTKRFVLEAQAGNKPGQTEYTFDFAPPLAAAPSIQCGEEGARGGVHWTVAALLGKADAANPVRDELPFSVLPEPKENPDACEETESFDVVMGGGCCGGSKEACLRVKYRKFWARGAAAPVTVGLTCGSNAKGLTADVALRRTCVLHAEGHTRTLHAQICQLPTGHFRPDTSGDDSGVISGVRGKGGHKFLYTCACMPPMDKMPSYTAMDLVQVKHHLVVQVLQAGKKTKHEAEVEVFIVGNAAASGKEPAK